MIARRVVRALQKAMWDDLENQHAQLRRDIIHWNPSMYDYNGLLTRQRWGW